MMARTSANPTARAFIATSETTTRARGGFSALDEAWAAAGSGGHQAAQHLQVELVAAREEEDAGRDPGRAAALALGLRPRWIEARIELAGDERQAARAEGGAQGRELELGREPRAPEHELARAPGALRPARRGGRALGEAQHADPRPRLAEHVRAQRVEVAQVVLDLLLALLARH